VATRAPRVLDKADAGRDAAVEVEGGGVEEDYAVGGDGEPTVNCETLESYRSRPLDTSPA